MTSIVSSVKCLSCSVYPGALFRSLSAESSSADQLYYQTLLELCHRQTLSASAILLPGIYQYKNDNTGQQQHRKVLLNSDLPGTGPQLSLSMNQYHNSTHLCSKVSFPPLTQCGLQGHFLISHLDPKPSQTLLLVIHINQPIKRKIRTKEVTEYLQIMYTTDKVPESSKI